jgi:transposase
LSDGWAWQVGGGRGGSGRAGAAEPLGRTWRGGPGAGGAVVAGGRDQRRGRGPAGRTGRAGAALACRVPARRGGGAAVAPAAGSRAPQARGGARGGRGAAGGERRRPAGLDLGPAGAGDRGAYRRDDLPRPPERGPAKRGYRWRRPRHTLKGRQDAPAVDYAGLRLKLLRQQARAGDIHLLFGDESEALTHPYLAHCWARRGAELRVEAPGRAKRRALLGALDHARRELTVLTSATKRSGDSVALLGRLDRDYGPAPGREDRPGVLVLDNGPIHTSKASREALAARPWLTVEWLPRYAPELNDIERSWRDLKRHYLAHQTFRDAGQLDRAVHEAVHALNRERRAALCASISGAA